MLTTTHLSRLAIAVLCTAAAAVAQENRNVVHVPLSDPKQPVRVRASLITGGITVRGADIQDVIVEGGPARQRIRERNRDDDDDPEAQGLKRIYPTSSSFGITEEHNQITIRTTPFDQVSRLIITVPRRASLQLKSMNDGGITVEGVDGEIDVDDLNGSITLQNVSGSVLAHSLNGTIHALFNRVDSGKPMSFSTLNGTIDVTLPESTKASVRMKTDNGEVYSDFDVKLSTSSPMEKSSGRQDDGTYRVRFDRVVQGTINGGGPEYQFTTFNGRIYIRRKK